MVQAGTVVTTLKATGLIEGLASFVGANGPRLVVGASAQDAHLAESAGWKSRVVVQPLCLVEWGRTFAVMVVIMMVMMAKGGCNDNADDDDDDDRPLDWRPQVWDYGTGRVERSLQGHTDHITSLATYSTAQGETRIVSLSLDGSCRVGWQGGRGGAALSIGPTPIIQTATLDIKGHP
jgi:hypothetical protein